jgi:hypothetical protein
MADMAEHQPAEGDGIAAEVDVPIVRRIAAEVDEVQNVLTVAEQIDRLCLAPMRTS